MDVELRHLRSFLAVADELSFTKAARRLRLSQPSLTRTVGGLERMIGTRLLNRTTRSVFLTEEGEHLRSDLVRVLGELDGILANTPEPAALRLGFTWLLPDVWAQQVINRFEQQTHTQVQLVRRDEEFAGVDRGEADIAVLRGHQVPEGLSDVVLFRERRVAAVRRESALAGRQRIHWHELAKYPLVINVVSGTTQVDLWPPEHRPTVVSRCENFDEWLEAIAAERGIGAVPVSAAYRVAHPAIRFIPVDDAPLVPVRLVHPRQGAHPFVKQFVDAAVRATIPRHAAPPVPVQARRKLPA